MAHIFNKPSAASINVPWSIWRRTLVFDPGMVVSRWWSLESLSELLELTNSLELADFVIVTGYVKFQGGLLRFRLAGRRRRKPFCVRLGPTSRCHECRLSLSMTEQCWLHSKCHWCTVPPCWVTPHARLKLPGYTHVVGPDWFCKEEIPRQRVTLTGTEGQMIVNNVTLLTHSVPCCLFDIRWFVSLTRRAANAVRDGLEKYMFLATRYLYFCVMLCRLG